MGSFGENLRREREMRGISLEEISSATKVSVRFLNALENSDFANIPGGIFTRGFIRAYAGYLGLDLEQVMAEYEAAAPPRDYELNRLTFASRPPPRRGRPIRILPLAIAVVLLAGGYSLFRYAHRSNEAPLATSAMTPSAPVAGSHPASVQQPVAPPATPSTSPPLPATAGVNSGAGASDTGKPSEPASDASGAAAQSPPDSTNPAVTQPGAAASPGAPPAGLRDEMVLQLAATEPVWVSVETDGKTSWQKVLHPNDVTTLKAKNYFDLTTGNAQGLILTLNGETLKPLGREGEVKKIHLTRNDLKSPNP